MAAAIPARSTFVTVVAWIFIVLSGFATLTGLMQVTMIAFFPWAEMQENLARQQASRPHHFPAGMDVVMGHFYLFFVFFFLVSASSLAASIGLLLRKNWARLLFIAMMGIGIAWCVVGVVLMFAFFAFFPEIPPASAGRPSPPFNASLFFAVAIGFNLVMAAGFCVLFGWIIRRLVSPAIRAEFRPLQAP